MPSDDGDFELAFVAHQAAPCHTFLVRKSFPYSKCSEAHSSTLVINARQTKILLYFVFCNVDANNKVNLAESTRIARVKYVLAVL